MKKLILFALIICLSVSCSSMRLISATMKSNYEPIDPQLVLVCEKGVGVPDTAVKIGEFATYDDGMAKTEPFETTIARIKEDAGSKGANVINIIEHIAPDRWHGSTNHQLAGDYLFAENFTVSEDNIHVRNYNAYESEKAERKSNEIRGGSLKVGVGPALLVNQYDFSEFPLKADPYRIHYGVAYEAGYDYIKENGKTYGFVVTGYSGKSPASLDNVDGVSALDFSVWAPTFGYCRRFDDIAVRVASGLGYGTYSESFRNGSAKTESKSGGIGFTVGEELLYRINTVNFIGMSIEYNMVAPFNDNIKATLEWWSTSFFFRRSF